MANQPILTLWEMKSGVPVSIPVLEWSPIDRGQESSEKTIRIYNNKGATGCAPAKDCKFTITDPVGGDSLEIIQGTSGNGSLPFLKAKVLSMCYSSKNENVCTSGNGSTGTYNMSRGQNGAYVAGSAIVRQEFHFGGAGNNASPQEGTYDIIITDPVINSDNPITSLPASIVVSNNGIPATYFTEGFTVDYSGGQIKVTLDDGYAGQPSAFSTPADMQISGNDARYTKTLGSGDFSITSGDPAQIVLSTPPGQNCRVWMDYVHRLPDTTWKDCGGSSHQIDCGGVTTILDDAVSGLDNVTPIIPDGGYAEIALKLVVPSDAQTGSNVSSRPTVYYNWSA